MAKRISKSRFDIFTIGTRTSGSILFQEISWWSDLDEKVIGTVAQDRTDNTYGWMILIRDEAGRFRCADLDHSFRSPRLAQAKLRIKIADIVRAADFTGTYEQFDLDHKPLEFFTPHPEVKNQSPYFKILIDDDSRLPARSVINEIANCLFPAETSFVKEFQSDHFDQRLWEIYLWASFQEMRLDVVQHSAPDFQCSASFREIDFTVEATTVTPSTSGVLKDYPVLDTDEKMKAFLTSYMPMKFGSPLVSKLNKVNAKNQHYWEHDHSAGKPFILAIADFHRPGNHEKAELGSMTYTQGAMFIYLYGHRVDWWLENGKLMMKEVKVETHEYKNKTIPSGFFDLPGAENISGVLFSNAGTLAKFDRMGVCAGFAHPDYKYMRMGFKFDPDPNAFMGTPFAVAVDDKDYTEQWCDELQLFHNPGAKIPVPLDWFPQIAHHNFIDGEHVTMDIKNRVLASMTLITKAV